MIFASFRSSRSPSGHNILNKEHLGALLILIFDYIHEFSDIFCDYTINLFFVNPD